MLSYNETTAPEKISLLLRHLKESDIEAILEERNNNSMCSLF